MQIQEHTLKRGQRVRLRRDGQDALYSFACAGSEGWVRKHEHDRMGYPMVFIEWDKDHWTYNGEPDRWAFEAHFEPVEEKVDMAESHNPQEFADMFSKFLEWSKSQEKQQENQPSADPERPTADDFRRFLETTLKTVSKNGDSVIVIWVDRTQPEGDPIPTLTPNVLNFYRSPEGGILAESKLSLLAQVSHDELAIERIHRILDERGEK